MKKFLLLFAVLIFIFAGCADSPQRPDPESKPSTASLRVHFMDVGQGDAAFIELPNGKTMLIDAGDVGRGDDIASYIKNLGCTEIDFLMATHPHADHIGGMAYIVDSFDIGEIFMPNVTTNTNVFETLLDAIEEKGLKIKTARAGVNMFSEIGLTADISAPNAEEYGDINNYSAAVKISYGETAFLFMGGAEILSENEIDADIRADVVKVGHHGSDSSSGEDFIRRTEAAYAIVSVGAENAYDHPSPLTIKRWRDAGAKVYRTDENGTVIAVSDGFGVTIYANVPSDIAPTVPGSQENDNPGTSEVSEWVLNTNTKKIHYHGCRVVPRISPSNYAVSDKTVKELSDEGFTACDICKPHDR